MPDESNNRVQGAFQQDISNPIIPEEKVGAPEDPLYLDIDDEDLIKIVEKRIETAKNFFDQKYDLTNRRTKNETYYFGRQIVDRERKGDLKPYESRNMDNVLYEIEASLKPLAMSRLPDMIVTPGGDNPESKDTADQVSKVLNTDLKKRANRIVLGIGFKHLPVYFTGVIKARWEPKMGKYGDYIFEVIHPDNIVVDETCPSNNADEMEFVAQALPLTVQDLFMRFPDKKDDITTELKKHGLMAQDKQEADWKDLATPVKIWEVWSSWYKKPTKSDAEESPKPEDNGENETNPQDNEWEKVEGVIWKFYDCILKKMKNPNYDWEGGEETFIYEDPSDETTRRPVNIQDAIQSMMTGQAPEGISTEQIYHNYFQFPRKPYFFLGYDQWHKIAYDETSYLEQNLRNQETLDKRGKQINETLDTRVKHVFSKDGGLKPDDIERMDMNDPNQDILVDGDVNKVHSFIPPDRPTPQEFEDLDSTRDRMYAIAGTQAVRGTVQSDTATSNQIAREADYTRADDLVEDTINAASEWMADWSLQFIKLRYTEDHMRKLLGAKGSITFAKLNRDMIEDGMEVMIKSSGTDKLKAQKNAMDMAGLKLIDPLTFYEDMDLDDPEGRAEKLLTFMSDPSSYIVKFLQGMGTVPQMVDGMLGPGATQQLQGQGQGGAISPTGSAPNPMVPQGNAPPVQPSPVNPQNIPATPPMGPPQASPRVL